MTADGSMQPWVPNEVDGDPPEPARRDMAEYYERRAPEYDDAYAGGGSFWTDRSERGPNGLPELISYVRALSPVPTLDVGCGTGYLTRHLAGPVAALDRSEAMLRLAAARLTGVSLVRANAVGLPFRDGSFRRLIAAHLYGHLLPADAARFLSEARRVAAEIIVVDTMADADSHGDSWEERFLSDGSRYRVLKRYFVPESLAAEIGGNVEHAKGSFVAVRTS